MFVPGKPLQPSLMFVGDAGCFTQVGSGLTCKYYTCKGFVQGMDKQSSLLRKSGNYGRKKFYNIGLRNWKNTVVLLSGTFVVTINHVCSNFNQCVLKFCTKELYETMQSNWKCWFWPFKWFISWYFVLPDIFMLSTTGWNVQLGVFQLD